MDVAERILREILVPRRDVVTLPARWALAYGRLIGGHRAASPGA